MKKRIYELDGLRAFAVLAVVIYHMVFFSHALPKMSRWVYKPIEYLGNGGVHVFFIISGYIITTLLIKDKADTGQVSMRAFYIRRFFRIIPPFATYLFVLFLLSCIGYISVSSINFFWSALFLGNLGLFQKAISSGTWFVAHTWSLSVEEQYYLVLPPIMSFFRFRLRILRILTIFLLFVSAYSFELSNLLSKVVDPCFSNLSKLFLFRYIVVGVIFALHKEFIHSILKRKSIVVPFICLGSIWAIRILIYFFDVPFEVLLSINVFEPILYGFFVLWFVANPNKCSVLRWKSIQYIGASSYSIYLWQQLFTGDKSLYSGLNIGNLLIAGIGISFCTYLSYRFIERPSIHLGREFSNRPISAYFPTIRKLASVRSAVAKVN